MSGGTESNTTALPFVRSNYQLGPYEVRNGTGSNFCRGCGQPAGDHKISGFAPVVVENSMRALNGATMALKSERASDEKRFHDSVVLAALSGCARIMGASLEESTVESAFRIADLAVKKRRRWEGADT